MSGLFRVSLIALCGVVWLVGCAPSTAVLDETTIESSAPAATHLPLIANGTESTVHVSPEGADSNSGTATDPWATLQYAVDNVPDGGMIIVHEGNYAGARIERSGTATAPLTLAAADGAEAIINRPGPNNRHESNLEIETWEEGGTVAYWIIEGLIVTEAPNWGIDVRGNSDAKNEHIIIRNNYVHNNGWASGKTGIFAAHTDYITIENNETANNGEHGIYVNNSSDHFTIRQNHVHHNANSGIHLNGDASAGDDGILSSGLVEANRIHDNGVGGGAGINMDGVTDTTVQNNLLYANQASGIAIFQQDGAVCSQGNLIYHNTIHMPENGRWALIVGQEDCVDNTILNNILYSEHGYRGSINLPTTAVSGLLSDYNVVTDRFTIDDGDSVLSLSAWQALGYDQHSFIVAPSALFADVAGENYTLPENSPARDGGQLLRAVSMDIIGTIRPQGNGYDIGAYEALDDNNLPPTGDAGVVVYRLGNAVYRLNTAVGTPENLTNALDTLYPAGEDEWINISPNGQWLLFASTRFDDDCMGWSCLILMPANLSTHEVIVAGSNLIHPDEMGAVSNDGNVILYPAPGESHEVDLWRITRTSNGWSDPVNLTASTSPHSFHSGPAIAADGSRTLFNCGPTAYRQAGTAVCELTIEGTAFREVVRPTDGPGSMGSADASVAHADYAPNGDIVFEADWDGEFIWRLSTNGGTPEKISGAYSNDNSPCVLPDGRVASLWLNRVGNELGYHELKLMAADGRSHEMLVLDQDIVDAGLGCGQP